MPLKATTIEALVSAQEPRVQALLEAARRRIQSAVPRATEKLRPGWGLIGYNAPAYFAFIAPSERSVRIGFEWGVLLRDKEGLLEGSGSQVRYFAVHEIADLRRPALVELLREAADIVPPPRRAASRHTTRRQ